MLASNREYLKVIEKLEGPKYSVLVKKLEEAGLTIKEIVCYPREDDENIFLQAQITSKDENGVPVLLNGDHMINLYVNNAKDLKDLTCKLWKLATNNPFFLKKNGNIFYEAVEINWGSAKEDSKFQRRKITEEEMEQIMKFFK